MDEVAPRRKSFEILINKLGVEFRDKSLLDTALLHRSYSSKHQIAKDNERFEFLGDSVLNACVSDILFCHFPEKSEGELTKIRANLVSGKSLKKWGEELGIGDYILISEKIKKHISHNHTRIIENTMEAIIGAIYLDGGFEAAYDFIKKYIEKQDFQEIDDFKSLLQEYVVEKYGEIPEYITISEGGPSHHKKFKISVQVNGKIMGSGIGWSKKSAQQKAAEVACKKLNKKGLGEGNKKELEDRL